MSRLSANSQAPSVDGTLIRRVPDGAALAFRRSVEGVQSGQVLKIGYSSTGPVSETPPGKKRH
ncbi:hypothetical protein MUU48_02140 [Scandinavium sp. H11S7]|uniref:hypothetical protein n=1 Tax=Scandinavium hiltneri TaxID=2926519 RepID=UPI0021659504|nr:hypothetical protein [Scandinavium hiltneri]MCS2155752.1 hypothetical protein [Scandinavium hiltneri]